MQKYAYYLLGNVNASCPSSLRNDKLLDSSKLKAFADDKLNAAVMMISVFDRVENTVGKGEHAGYQHFLLFPQCFPKTFPYRRLHKSLQPTILILMKMAESYPNQQKTLWKKEKLLNMSNFSFFHCVFKRLDKIVDLSKLKGLPDIKLIQKLKRRNYCNGYQHFLHFPWFFQKLYSFNPSYTES